APPRSAAPTTTTSSPSTGRGADVRHARGAGSFAWPQEQVRNRHGDDEDGEGDREGDGADAHETGARRVVPGHPGPSRERAERAYQQSACDEDPVEPVRVIAADVVDQRVLQLEDDGPRHRPRQDADP